MTSRRAIIDKLRDALRCAPKEDYQVAIFMERACIAGIIATLQAAEAAERQEPVAWFVERTDDRSFPARPYKRWLSGFDYENCIWTNDPLEAIRFCRKEDAEKLTRCFGLPEIQRYSPFASSNIFLSAEPNPHPDRHADCQDECQTAAARGPAYRCDNRRCDVLACEEYDRRKNAV